MKIKTVLLMLASAISAKSQVPGYVPTSSLVAWYGLNGTTNDLSGNNNHLTAFQASLTTDRNSTANSAYEFCIPNTIVSSVHQLNSTLGHSVSYLETNTSFHNPSIPHSISFWWKMVDTMLFAQVFYGSVPNRIQQLGYGWDAFMTAASHHTISVGLGSTYGNTNDILHENNLNSKTPSPTNLAKWHHTVWLLDNSVGTLRIYIDAVLANTFTFTPMAITATTTILRFGNNDNNAMANVSGQFSGKLDEIGIWNRILNDCEIKALYSGQFLSVSGSSNTLCAGSAATLVATGADTFTWTNGSSTATGSTLVISPTTSASYSIIGTHTLSGCNYTNVYTQSVLPAPSLTVNMSPGTVCVGESVTLTASGADIYSWNGTAGASSIVATASIGTQFTVQGTNQFSCSSVETISLNVSDCVGLSETKLSFQPVLFFPNPFSQKLNLVDTRNVKDIRVSNVLGKMVEVSITLANQTATVDFSQNGDGIYFIHVTDHSGTVRTLKVFKQQ
jgi:hypothetical protein